MQIVFDVYALLFGRTMFRKMNRALLRCALAGLGVLNWRSETLQGERDLLTRLLAEAPKGAVALDIGANEGRYSAWLLSQAPHLTVHAFEPHPIIFGRLEARLETAGARCWNCALGDVEGETELFDYADAPGGSSHASLHNAVIERLHGRPAAAHRVAVRRLDNFLLREGITEIFLLKIDTEGHEAAVLRGLGDLAQTGKVTIHHLQLEFGDMNVISRTFFEDIAALLPGYRAFRILPRGALLEITNEPPLMRELFAFQNILFSRTEPA